MPKVIRLVAVEVSSEATDSESDTHCTTPGASVGGSGSKESAGSVGDLGSMPGLGRSPGEGNGNPLQYA